jgi:hypothetical protein
MTYEWLYYVMEKMEYFGLEISPMLVDLHVPMLK